MNQSMDSENRKPMERVLYEVKKIIVGQDHMLERLVVALLARGHILVEVILWQISESLRILLPERFLLLKIVSIWA